MKVKMLNFAIATIGILLLFKIAMTESSMKIAVDDEILMSDNVFIGVVKKSGMSNEDQKNYMQVTFEVKSELKGDFTDSEIVVEVSEKQIKFDESKGREWISFEPGMELLVLSFMKNGKHIFFPVGNGTHKITDGYIADYDMTIEEYKELVEDVTEKPK